MLAVLDVRFKLETPDAALHMSALHKPSNATKLYSRGACDQFEQTLKFNQDLVVSFLNSKQVITILPFGQYLCNSRFHLRQSYLQMA